MVRVGLWGAFDGGLGDAVRERIVRAELRRRLPGLTVRTWSPDGSCGESLGEPTDARLDELAGAIDVLVIVPGDDPPTDPFFVEGLGAANEAFVPTAWLGLRLGDATDPDLDARVRQVAARRASIGVGDAVSLERLHGLEVDATEVPDPLLLADRLFRADEPEERTARLRTAGLLPEGDLLVVQGDGSLLPHVEPLAAALGTICDARSLTPVLVTTGPGDGGFPEALAEHLAGASALPAGTDHDDLCAVLGWCAAFVGRSRAAALVTTAYDRPAVIVDPNDDRTLAEAVASLGAPERHVTHLGRLGEAFDRVWDRGSIAERLTAMRARLDEHFDELANLPTSVPDDLGADAAAVRSLLGRLAALERAASDREHELQVMIGMLTRHITEADIRFEGLWKRIHQGDVNYAWQFNRAEEAEELVRKLREEVAWLQSVVDERDRVLDQRNRQLERARAWLRPYYWLRDRRKGSRSSSKT